MALTKKTVIFFIISSSRRGKKNHFFAILTDPLKIKNRRQQCDNI